jgi:hypothetical protein
VGNDSSCLLQYPQIAGIFSDQFGDIPLILGPIALHHGWPAMGMQQSPIPYTGLLARQNPAKNTAQVKIVQHDHTRIAFKQIEHMGMIFGIAELIQDAIIVMRVLLKPCHRTQSGIPQHP